jgi:hypothetical protein
VRINNPTGINFNMGMAGGNNSQREEWAQNEVYIVVNMILLNTHMKEKINNYRNGNTYKKKRGQIKNKHMGQKYPIRPLRINNSG